MSDLSLESVFSLTSRRSKLLKGAALKKFSTEEERATWREIADQITAELFRRNELKGE